MILKFVSQQIAIPFTHRVGESGSVLLQILSHRCARTIEDDTSICEISFQPDTYRSMLLLNTTS